MLNVKIVAQIRASLLRSSTKTKMADTLYPSRNWIFIKLRIAFAA